MNIVDLFSGAGGLTFGFYYDLVRNNFVRTDNKIVFANEFDKKAAEAFRLNYPDIQMINDDIKNLTDEKIKEIIKEDEIDLIIGGPPCQSFSTVGQRRYDDKAKLYIEYIRLLNVIRPKMFLFENVKGILSMKEVFYVYDENDEIVYDNIVNKKTGHISSKPRVDHYGEKIMDKLEDSFEAIGYTIKYETLNAVNFGVPQERERVFIIGIRNDLDLDWIFPAVLNSQPITIKEAISDLPVLGLNQSIENYGIKPENKYQKLMRNRCRKLTQHICGDYGDKIRTVIANVEQGQGKDDFNKLIDDGIIDEKYRLTSGYNNTYARLIEDQPSTTITNNMCTPSALRCIHYSQNRALSPREGARIQSFPDWFQFSGNRTDVTRQIGNAVPPLLAIAMARQIEKTLGE